MSLSGTRRSETKVIQPGVRSVNHDRPEESQNPSAMIIEAWRQAMQIECGLHKMMESRTAAISGDVFAGSTTAVRRRARARIVEVENLLKLLKALEKNL
jgi:hypothetical protein